MKEQTQPTQLNQVTFNEIAGAFSRLQQLGDKQIDAGPSDNTAAEKEKLIEYLAMKLLEHCGEFLAAWMLTHGEYLPLLRTIRACATRGGFLTPPVPPSNN